jgi:hypothetical protein
MQTAGPSLVSPAANVAESSLVPLLVAAGAFAIPVAAFVRRRRRQHA